MVEPQEQHGGGDPHEKKPDPQPGHGNDHHHPKPPHPVRPHTPSSNG